MQRYFETKARLFRNYPARNRIVNLDSEYGAELASRCGQDIVTVSTRFDRVANGRPFVFVRSVVANDAGSHVRIASSWRVSCQRVLSGSMRTSSIRPARSPAMSQS